MRSTFFGIEIGARSLYTQRTALETTGHNIANANTPGYSRQRVDMGTTDPFTVPSFERPATPGQIGTGVQVEQIRRLRNFFLDLRYRQESSTLGKWDAISEGLREVELFIGEPSDSGVRSALDKFWASLEELANEPESRAVRESVREKTEVLVSAIKHVANSLQTYRDDINNEVKMRVDEINSLVRQISNLNVEIIKVESTGDNANDLRDKQNYLVEKLAKLINIDVKENPGKGILVSTDGFDLVRGTKHHEFVVHQNPGNDGYYEVRWDIDDFPVSSNVSVVTAVVSPDAEQRFHTVEVFQLANELSHKVGNPTAASIASPDVTLSALGWLGKNEMGTFGIKVGSNPEVEITVTGEDTLRTIANKINAAYNNSSVYSSPDVSDNWVEAQVEKSATGKYYLTVKSNKPGESHKMTITDHLSNIAYRLGLIDATGNTNDINTPQDAIFRIDGVDYRSAYNRIEKAVNQSTGEEETVTPGVVYTLTGVGSASVSAKKVVKNGKLYGLLKVRDSIIPYYMKQLDNLAYTLINEMNAQHRAGYGLGDEDRDVNGVNLFEPLNVNKPYGAAKEISLNPQIDEDLNKIAAAAGDGYGHSAGDGDNQNALKLAGLKHRAIMSGGTTTFSDFFESLLSRLGVDSQEAKKNNENQETMVKQIDHKRQETSGVSLDEEMANIVKFQRVYEASARFITVQDSIINRIINGMGLVGR